MTGVVPAPDEHERAVLRDVLDALLREDHIGLSSRAVPDGPGWWLVTGLPAHPDGALRLPVQPDGFLAAHRLAAPHVVLCRPGGDLVLDRLAAVLDALAPCGDAEAMAGWALFTAECDGELAARRIGAAAAPAVRRRLDDAGLRPGLAGLPLLEAVAALAGHPVHPTGRCRHGLTPDELRAYTPECAPRFALRWAALPADAVVWQGRRPGWWPSPADVGLLAGEDTVLLPVHPLTAARLGGYRLAPCSRLDVTPTLSTRTVAVLDDPAVHLKLPLATATLGARNRRTIGLGTLADGAAVQRLLHRVATAEPDFAGRILHADETSYGYTRDEHLAVLVRRYPPGLGDALLVPVAALAAPEVFGRLPAGTLDAYLDLLVDWHVALWLRHGIALEAHQQNITLVLRPGRPLALLYKDNDGARVDPARPPGAPPEFADPRIVVRDPAELADVFTTITLHLCAAAPLFALRGHGFAVPHPAQALRPRLAAALRRFTDPADAGSAASAALLRERILDAGRLPVKAMVTAGTLLPKHRLGCPDINKYYLRTGPNYLAPPGGVRA